MSLVKITKFTCTALLVTSISSLSDAFDLGNALSKEDTVSRVLQQVGLDIESPNTKFRRH